MLLVRSEKAFQWSENSCWFIFLVLCESWMYPFLKKLKTQMGRTFFEVVFIRLTLHRHHNHVNLSWTWIFRTAVIKGPLSMISLLKGAICKNCYPVGFVLTVHTWSLDYWERVIVYTTNTTLFEMWTQIIWQREGFTVSWTAHRLIWAALITSNMFDFTI